MLITSGYEFDGYRITKYLDFCSGECAMGTGFLSSFGANLADFLGKNSSLYESKLNKAREHALKQLIASASSLGADGIIAIEMNYTVFSADIMGVTANGTAVKIEKIAESLTYPTNTLNVKNFNPDLPIKPVNMQITPQGDKCSAVLTITDITQNNISAISCDVEFTTTLDDYYCFENLPFYDFRLIPDSVRRDKTSAAVPVSLPPEQVGMLKSVRVTIRKYCDLGVVVIPEVNDVEWQSNTAPKEMNSTENDGSAELPFSIQFKLTIKEMKTAKEIYEYCVEYNNTNRGVIPPDLIENVKAMAVKERLYGNMYDECIKKIEKII